MNKGVLLCDSLYYSKLFSRKFSIFFPNLLLKTHDITYKKNIDLVFTEDSFFYTVLNVDRYKYFLPYIKESKIIEKQTNQLKAILEIENFLFKEKYTSLVTFKYPTSVLVVSEDTHIFHHLITEWCIHNKKDHINVDFYIQFRLKNIIYQNFMNVYIKELGKKILNAFIKECKENSLKNIDIHDIIK